MNADQGHQDRIVVGIDGSEPSARALRWALEEARRTGAVVDAVHAYEVPVAAGASIDRLMEFVRADARRLLDDVVAPVAGAHPEVPVHRRVRRGPAGPALVRAGVGARLLVVGSRGHRPVVGLLLGSVAQHCAGRAPCPVVVIPHQPVPAQVTTTAGAPTATAGRDGG